jgi:dienelactone hydrolase
VNDQFPLQEFSVEVSGGVRVPVLVQLPPQYTPQKEWPLIFAMHGGPSGTVAQTRPSAERMIKVWAESAARAGWIVAAPAMIPTVTAGARGEQRLPYEVFHLEQAEAVISALRARYRINPDRLVSTGISLGSNFSIQYACAQPGWLAAIVPVSTEGDSRELLLRNLKSTPVYLLEGALDKNIWGIAGPRALSEILTGFGYDLMYREFPARAHEGFQEHYDDVLRWLELRPRQNYPHEVLRVPHTAIIPAARRVHWIETDTRQGLVRAAITSPTRIEITTRWTRELTLYLHDQLVNLDGPLEVWVNGVKAFTGQVPRSIATALKQARMLGDERRIYAASLRVKVPSSPAATQAGQKLSSEFQPRQAELTLSFWERFAVGALEERLPTVGCEGAEVSMPSGVEAGAEQVAMRVTQVEADGPMGAAGLRVGDLLLEVAGEPFFRGQGGLAQLRQWLMRELRGEAADYSLTIWRNGQRQILTARLKLGPYAAAKAASGKN